MSLTTPKINMQQTTFNAEEDFVINFNVIGGDQVIANTLEVYDLSNNLVYTNTTPDQTFTLTNIIFANKLQNGSSYKLHVCTKNSSGSLSQFSDWVVVNCYSNPIIDITNIEDGGIYNNQDCIPQGNYIQAEDDPLQYYRYILYDSNMLVLIRTDMLRDRLLTYQFAKLKNNTIYTIELQATTKHNVTASIQKTFTTEYIAPIFNNFMTLKNNPDLASVDIEIIAIRTIGHIKSGTVTLEDNEWVNCLNGIVQFDDQNNDGLYFEYNNGNWQMQLRLKGLIDDYTPINYVLEGTLIMSMYGDNGIMFKLEYYNGMFHLYKYITVGNKYKIMSHYASNIVNATSDDVVYLFMNCQNDRIGMQAINLSNNNLKEIDQDKCFKTFGNFKKMHDIVINELEGIRNKGNKRIISSMGI